MDWITDQIAVGSFIDAENASRNEVDAIPYLKENCCTENNTTLDVMCLPLIDGPGNDRRHFGDAVDFIDDVVASGERILVHCHAGRSRSVCMVARYFMIKHGMTIHQTLEKIKSKREAFLSPGIEEVLVI